MHTRWQHGDNNIRTRNLLFSLLFIYNIKESGFTIITSDNPRKEDPQCIVDEILQGIPSSLNQGKDYEVIVDRKKAIQFAIHQARPGDLVMIAGKGHEDYQILKAGPVTFDDRRVAIEAMRRMQ